MICDKFIPGNHNYSYKVSPPPLESLPSPFPVSPCSKQLLALFPSLYISCFPWSLRSTKPHRRHSGLSCVQGPPGVVLCPMRGGTPLARAVHPSQSCPMTPGGWLHGPRWEYLHHMSGHVPSVRDFLLLKSLLINIHWPSPVMSSSISGISPSPWSR